MRLTITILALLLISCGQGSDQKINELLDSAQANMVKDKQKMKTYLDSAETLGASSKEFYTLRGLSDRENDAKSSIKYFNKLLELYPDDTVGYVYRAQSFMMAKEWEKADRDYTTAIQKGFSYEAGLSECYFNRGVAREELERTNEARLDFEKAIEINPKDAMAFGKLGDLAAMEDDFKTACMHWRKSVE